MSLSSVPGGAAASNPQATSDLPKRLDCAIIKVFIFSLFLPCREEPCPCRLGKSPLEARGIHLGRRGWHYNIAGTLWMDLSQELKGGRWQFVKRECRGGQVQALAVSGLHEGGHTTFRRQGAGEQRLKCGKRYLQTAN